MNKTNNKTSINMLIEKGYGNVVVFSNPDYTTALIGLTPTNQAVYDYNLMVEYLVTNENMNEEEAEDFICYNDSFCYGKNYPVIYYGEDVEEEILEEDPEYKPLVFTKIEDLPSLN